MNDTLHTGPIQRPLRRTIDLAAYLGYAVAVVMTAFGVAVLSGLFVHSGVPSQLRLTFGIVLLLMGIYRAVLTRTKTLERRREEREEEGS